MRVRLVAALAAGCLAVATSAISASAAPRHGSAQPIGGPLLAATGVVERPLPGAPSLPPASQLPASSWMVTDLSTGQVLAAKDPHGKYLPASTLKTLTAVTLLPKLSPTATFRPTFKDVNVDGSRVGLIVGMSYTIAKLFTCMLVVSANDAADALAEANGGIPKTIREMNAEAHKLQAFDTVAKTPSGLDGVGESTSAYDLALIAQAGFGMPSFRHYLSIVRSNVPAPHNKHFAIYTHNHLLTEYRGDIGGKNGYTVAAQGTYVGAATRHGHPILVTLMHAYPNFWPMATDLLNWGFKATGKVAPVGELVAPLRAPKPQRIAVPKGKLASNVVKSATSGHGVSVSWVPIEIALAAITALAFMMLGVRRRRSRRRRYRPRLKLPPI